MPQERLSSTPPARGPWAHLRGHVLQFDPAPPIDLSWAAGLRLLSIALLLEAVIGPRMSLLTWLGLPLPPVWLRAPILLGLALLLVRFFAGLELPAIGLRPWRVWTTTERSYFLQVLVIAVLVLSAVSAARLRAIAADPTLRGPVGVLVVTHLVWGFYQEVVYRGILQTGLQRLWGAWPALLVANVAFTFGPLHFYHASSASPWPMFAAIFAIGLFFGILFQRSRHLWIVGVFHGIGDVFLTGLPTLAP